MARQNHRKRAFSKAFQPTVQDYDDPLRGPGRSAMSSSDAWTLQNYLTTPGPFDDDKENKVPSLFPSKMVQSLFPGAPQMSRYEHHQSAPYTAQSQAQRANHPHPLHDLSGNYHITSEGSDRMLPPSSNQSSSPFNMQHFSASTQHHSQPYSSPPTVITSSPPSKDVLGCSSESGLPIFEDLEIAMCDSTGPLTPSALNLQELSLLDIPAASGPPRRVKRATRPSFFAVPTSVFEGCFSHFDPSEVIVIFAHNTRMVKVCKFILSAASRFFASLLLGPFINGEIHCLRLRSDFPPAITAMLNFINSGTYDLNPAWLLTYPHLTLLDLHIHVYLAGTKYQIPRLRAHAAHAYMRLAELAVLSMRSVPAMGASPTSGSGRDLDVEHLLNSLTLLWRNTPSRDDVLRAGVLELLKVHLNALLRVPFFVTMILQLRLFGADVVQSLEEDGFSVVAGVGMKGGVVFAGSEGVQGRSVNGV